MIWPAPPPTPIRFPSMTLWGRRAPPESETVPEMNTPLAWLPEIVFPAPVVMPPTVTARLVDENAIGGVAQVGRRVAGVAEARALVPISLPAIRIAEDVEHIDPVGMIAGDHVPRAGRAADRDLA